MKIKNCGRVWEGRMKKISFDRTEHLFFHIMLIGVLVFGVLLSGVYSPAIAKNIQQKTFTSPDDAVKALVEAVKSNNRAELLTIFGPEGKELISSGDEVADKAGCQKFLKAYEEANKLETMTPDLVLLHVGADDWTFPIPIVKKDNAWFFDTKEGREEILNRRIGKNEMSVINVLHEYVDAQREYASKDRNGDGVLEYAQNLVSTKSKENGLYWKAKEGEEESPFGPLIAKAACKGYGGNTGGGELSPYYGYYYKILSGQGKHATGGAYNYIVKGKMILGFALIAYPARYGNSGVMTFLVNQEGIVYEKDLGKNTETLAKAIKTFDPDKTWKRVE
jgi:hypothetical protein